MSANVNTLFKPITVGAEKTIATIVKSPEVNTTSPLSTTTTSAPLIPTTTTAATTTTTTTTTTATTATTTTTTATTATTATKISTGQTENVRYIPPVFFIGATENKKEIHASQDQELIRSGSLSLGHDERRLSTVFPEDAQNDTKNQGNSALKVLLKPESSSRGLFGDGSVEKAVDSVTEPKLTIVESEGMGHIGSEIQITGFKQGTENELLDYLQRYGKIVKHETINGKLVVQFEEPSSAIAALKSDGFVCQGQKILVKLHDVTTNEPSDNDNDEQGRLPPSKRLEIPTNLYKSTNKLGSGQHGITALDRNTCIRPTDRPKEVSFYTRILELVLGW